MPKLETCIKGDGGGGDKCTQGFKSSFLFKLSQDQAFTMSGRVLLLLAVERVKGTGSFWAPPPCRDSSAAAVNDLIRLGLRGLYLRPFLLT